MSSRIITVTADQAGQTVAAVLRSHLPDSSWNDVRRMVAGRRVKVLEELCLDPARRLREGDTLEFLARPASRPRTHENIVIRYLDEHLVVVEKPSGLSTVRHPSEKSWNERRKKLSPTLEDLVPKLIAREQGRLPKGKLPRLRIVQRLDKETSGLVVFARSVDAERSLGRQFRRHTVIRRYLAIVPGTLPSQRIATHLARNRGDGRRGSTTIASLGKEAITHVEVEERLPEYSLLSCRLETGRTHQIRIHVAELGHPVCGEKVYNRSRSGDVFPDASGAPRLALHATELGLVHPITGAALHWTMLLPADLQALWERLRGRAAKGKQPSANANPKPGHAS